MQEKACNGKTQAGASKVLATKFFHLIVGNTNVCFLSNAYVLLETSKCMLCLQYKKKEKKKMKEI